MRMRTRIVLLQRAISTALLILPVAACTRSRAPSVPVPTTTTRVDSSSMDRNDSWTPKVTAGTSRYLIRDSSVISINNDTSARAEPIESAILYTISLQDSSGSLAVQGRVDSLFLSSHLSRKSTTDTSQGAEVHGVVSKSGHTTQISITSTPCTGTNASPVLRINELLIPLPMYSIKVGDKWSDTLSTTICRGRIPIAQVAERDYELLDLSSCPSGGVRVRQTVVSTFTGSSPEGTNHLSASGSGTGSSTLCIDRSTGVLLESHGQSELQLTVTTTRGIFPFTQKNSTRIEKQ